VGDDAFPSLVGVGGDVLFGVGVHLVPGQQHAVPLGILNEFLGLVAPQPGLRGDAAKLGAGCAIGRQDHRPVVGSAGGDREIVIVRPTAIRIVVGIEAVADRPHLVAVAFDTQDDFAARVAVRIVNQEWVFEGRDPLLVLHPQAEGYE